MTIDWWTLGLQTVNVLILIWILARFLFRPVAKIVAERQAAAHTALDAAEAACTEAEATRTAAAAEIAKIAATRAALLAKARNEAKQERERLYAAARVEADEARAETRAELDQVRKAGRAAIAKDAAVLATDIATRLVARLPDAARVDGFIDGLVKAVTDLPQATRRGIGADGPVRLSAARDLTGDEQARLETRLSEVLGHPITLDVAPDPALIAGLELDAPHAIIRNHFRADLDRIAAELARDV